MKNGRAKSLKPGQISKKADMFLSKCILKFLRGFEDAGYYETKETRELFEQLNRQWKLYCTKYKIEEHKQVFANKIDKIIKDVAKAGRKIIQPTNGDAVPSMEVVSDEGNSVTPQP